MIPFENDNSLSTTIASLILVSYFLSLLVGHHFALNSLLISGITTIQTYVVNKLIHTCRPPQLGAWAGFLFLFIFFLLLFCFLYPLEAGWK